MTLFIISLPLLILASSIILAVYTFLTVDNSSKWGNEEYVTAHEGRKAQRKAELDAREERLAKMRPNV